MKGLSLNIEQETIDNSDFRRVLYTGQKAQLVLMSLDVGTEIGSEVHPDNDQFFRFEAGQGFVVVDDNRYEVGHGSAVMVPSGAEHNVINTSDAEALKFYTLYSPPHHKDGLVHPTKDEAAASHEHFDGKTTE